MSTLTLPVSEQFGPTIQGEGPYAGRVCQFIRLGSCNLACEWCDSAWTWDDTRFDLATENPPVHVDLLIKRAQAGMLTIISGGEPLMHQRRPAWEQLLRGLTEKGCEIHIETNGTLPPNEVTKRYVNAASISPKLPNAGGHRRGQSPMLHDDWSVYVNGSTDKLARNAVLKFVVETANDVQDVAHLCRFLDWPEGRVWVMPQGVTADEIQGRWAEILSAAAVNGLNASHRLHTLAFGEARGV